LKLSITWDPELVDRVASLHLIARELVWGMTSGMHRSNRTTRSIEFVEHKEYTAGDPIRNIDWKVYARNDRLMIRKQQADTEANIIVIVDASGDMATTAEGYPSLEDSKLGKAVTLAASLTLYAKRRAEPIGLFLMGGKEASHAFIPPSRRSTAAIFDTLTRVKAHGEANVGEALFQVAQRLQKKSIVIIISDWMEEPSDWGPVLETVAAAGHDIRTIQLFSRQEWELQLPESIKLFSYELPNEISVDIDSVRDNFVQIVEDYRKEVQQWAVKCKTKWTMAPIEDSLVVPLVQVVKGM
jgi:uncharacterized protein (DUF58 family)